MEKITTEQYLEEGTSLVHKAWEDGVSNIIKSHFGKDTDFTYTEKETEEIKNTFKDVVKEYAVLYAIEQLEAVEEFRWSEENRKNIWTGKSYKKILEDKIADLKSKLTSVK